MQLLDVNNTVSITTTVVSVVVSLQLFFLKWLKDSFVRVGNDLRSQGTQMFEWLKDHEEKDQSRHEANLARFEQINIHLARQDKTYRDNQ